MKLAEVDLEIERIITEEIDRETGELSSEVEARLDALTMERDRIMLYLARVIIGEECEATAVEQHAKRLADRVRIHRNHADRLRAFVETRLEPGKKLSDDFAQIGWRRSESVEVSVDALELPLEYCRTTYAPAKAEIKEALKRGETVHGCRLVTRQSIQVR